MKGKDINFDTKGFAESAKNMSEQLINASKHIQDALKNLPQSELDKFNFTKQDIQDKVFGLNSELKDLQRKIKGL